MQHTDPTVLSFLLQYFPGAHFLHIVRHPFEVVASSDRFNQTANRDFWRGLSAEEKSSSGPFTNDRCCSPARLCPGASTACVAKISAAERKKNCRECSSFYN